MRKNEFFRLKPTYSGNNLNLTKSGCGTCEEAHHPNGGWKLSDCSTCDFNNCNGAMAKMTVSASVIALSWLILY
jgi:hypothetical protein